MTTLEQHSDLNHRLSAAAEALRDRVDGEVRFDPGTRAAYSTDASNFRQLPLGVVLPHSIDAAVEAVRVCHEHPGIVLDDLNRQLAPTGLRYGPEPATHPNCTLGGMIGNNSCGATAQRTGKVVDNVFALDVVLRARLRRRRLPRRQRGHARRRAAGRAGAGARRTEAHAGGARIPRHRRSRRRGSGYRRARPDRTRGCRPLPGP